MNRTTQAPRPPGQERRVDQLIRRWNDEAWQDLLEKSRAYLMTPEEQDEQAISFAYGNVHLADDRVTIEDIRSAREAIKRGQGVSS